MPGVREIWRAALLACFASGNAGCVGVPFALPPTRVEVGSGVREVERAKPSRQGTTDNPLEVQAGVHPLGFGRDLLDRRVDVGAGYIYQGGPLARVHGAYLEAQGFIGRWHVGPDAIARVGARTQVRLLGTEGEALLGRGGAFGLTAEIVTFGTGTFGTVDRQGGAFGVTHGEGGIGLAIDGAYAQVGDATLTSVTGSLTFRIPIVVGFAFKWLWEK